MPTPPEQPQHRSRSGEPAKRVFLVLYDTPNQEEEPSTPPSFEEMYTKAVRDALEIVAKEHGISLPPTEIMPEDQEAQSPLRKSSLPVTPANPPSPPPPEIVAQAGCSQPPIPSSVDLRSPSEQLSTVKPQPAPGDSPVPQPSSPSAAGRASPQIDLLPPQHSADSHAQPSDTPAATSAVASSKPRPKRKRPAVRETAAPAKTQPPATTERVHVRRRLKWPGDAL